MGKLRRPDWIAREQSAQAKLDASAAATWKHPTEGEAKSVPPVALAAEMLRRIMADTIPDPKHCGGGRRLRVGYVRYCAWVYRVCPEMYLGLDDEAMAKLVGVHRSNWYRQLAAVDAALRRRSATGK